MRIMIDSNVIVSAIYNRYSKPAHVLHYVCENQTLVLCDHIVAECYDVVERKFSQHTVILDKLLASLRYELVAAPRAGLTMADPKDAPILNSAILADVDILISGDKHFLALDMEHPKVLSPAQYYEIVRHKPNAVTQAAIAEAEQLLHDPTAKSFTSMEELRADLLSDEDEDDEV